MNDVLLEKRELDGRIKKLRDLIETGEVEKLSNNEQSRIRIQLSAMETYSRVLGERYAIGTGTSLSEAISEAVRKDCFISFTKRDDSIVIQVSDKTRSKTQGRVVSHENFEDLATAAVQQLSANVS